MLKLRALVVEDSSTVRTLIKKLLRQTGLAEWEFDEAVDGVDGLEVFDAEATDIIFLDWNMPRMSGVHFAYEVRAIPAAKKTPIVMVTTETSMGKVMDAMDNAGVDHYICKPFTVDELRAKIAPIVEQIAAQRSPAPKARGGLLGRLLGKH